MVAMLRRGDKAALEAIYRRYADFLFRYAIKRVGCPDTAADLIQELFLRLWGKREELDIQGELQAWLSVCLRNLVIDYYSHQQVRRRYIARSIVTETDDSTTNFLDYRDTQERLQGGIEALPEKMRYIFHLNRMEEYSIDEIAQELKISRQTVKNQLGSAIKRLRVSLSFF